MPIDQRHAFVRGESLPVQMVGAVLFADISGFTKLTDMLSYKLGQRRGQEELTRYLNHVYGDLIAEVHRYGGSVLGFSGDAITCWLDGDDGQRAVACAIQMQQVMTELPDVDGEQALGLKVGIATGTVRRFLVGAPTIQLIPAQAGWCVNQAALAEGVAVRGDIIVTEAVANHLGERLVVGEWRDDAENRFGLVEQLKVAVEPAPWPAVPEQAGLESEAGRWLQTAVYERLLAGKGDFLAELRPATAVFVKFDGIDYENDPAASQKLDNFIQQVQTIVDKYEGAFLQLTIGDKGSYLYVNFGAPIAHTDDSARAIAAALDIRDAQDGLDGITKLQIGISRGEMWSGAYGSQMRRTYGVLGDQTNMAARLMSVAKPGQILAHQQVVTQVGAAFRFNYLGIIEVKGKGASLPVSEVTGRQTGPKQQAIFDYPLVGREDVLADMAQILEQVASGSGRILCLEGTSGIGKSHLVSKFSQLATQRGFRMALGVADGMTQTTSYYPWQQIVETLLPLPPLTALGSGAQAQQIAITIVTANVAQLKPEWILRLPLLGDVLHLPIPENPTTAVLDPELRQKSLFALITDMVRLWGATQPLLLILENGQWLDEASLALLQSLAAAIADVPVLLLLVQRPDSHLESKLGSRQIMRLQELPASDVATLVENRLQGRATPLVHDLVQARAQGNPFFAEELIDLLRKGDHLAWKDNAYWTLTDELIGSLQAVNGLQQANGTLRLEATVDLTAVSLEIPRSIHGLVLSRIDRLPESHKLTLKVASVIGYRFGLPLLEQSHPLQPSHLLVRTQADELNDQQIIFPEDIDANYQFRHQATQEVAYETLLFEQRRRLHRAVATKLAEWQPDALGQIAHHAFLSQDWAFALPFQLEAGKKAQQLFANQQGVSFYQQALSCLSNLSSDDFADHLLMAHLLMTHLALGELLVTLGEWETAVSHLNNAAEFAQELQDDDALVMTRRWLARSYELRGDYPPALEWIEDGLAILAGRETPDAIELRITAGLIHTRQGDYDQALAQCRRSLAMADRIVATDPSPTVQAALGRGTNLLGVIVRLGSGSQAALPHFEEASEIYRQAENIHGQGLALNHLATAYFDLGQWDKADAIYKEARAIFDRIGDVYHRLLIDNNLGGIAVNQGRLDEARDAYQAALQTLTQMGGSRWVMGALHLNLGATYVRRQEIETAFSHLEQGEALFAEAEVRDLLPELYRHFARAALQKGDLAGASAYGQQALEIGNELSMHSEIGKIERVLGNIAMAQGKTAVAEQHYAQGLQLLEEASEEYELACCQLDLVELYRQQGDAAKSEALLASCSPTLTRLGANLELEKIATLT
ncbi:MAG: tetratricopeptide repeat protein [Chloroflexota bacterium]